MYLDGDPTVCPAPRMSILNYFCDQNSSNTTSYVVEMPACVYNIYITSKFACPVKPNEKRTFVTIYAQSNMSFVIATHLSSQTISYDYCSDTSRFDFLDIGLVRPINSIVSWNVGISSVGSLLFLGTYRK